MKKFILFSLFIISVIFLSGCGAPSAKPTSIIPTQTETQVKNTVLIQNFAFTPALIKIKKGEKVTWLNKDSVTHKIFSSSFNSGNLDTGQTFEFTFNETGTFDYNCSIHPSMKGQIEVN